MYDDVTLCMMMWHYTYIYNQCHIRTLAKNWWRWMASVPATGRCVMMWHYVWWCDTMYDDVTLYMWMACATVFGHPCTGRVKRGIRINNTQKRPTNTQKRHSIPASVYREGKARYEDHPRLTEHFSVISRAREMGLPVVRQGFRV